MHTSLYEASIPSLAYVSSRTQFLGGSSTGQLISAYGRLMGGTLGCLYIYVQNNKLILVISKLIQQDLCVHTQQTFNLTCAAQNGEQSEMMSGKILLLPSCTCSECQDGIFTWFRARVCREGFSQPYLRKYNYKNVAHVLLLQWCCLGDS